MGVFPNPPVSSMNLTGTYDIAASSTTKDIRIVPMAPIMQVVFVDLECWVGKIWNRKFIYETDVAWFPWFVDIFQ